MIIQFNTDKNIEHTQNLESFFSKKISNDLKHFTNNITRIEVHLSDQNAEKQGPDDMQCKLEARVEGKPPVIVISKNGTKEKALDDAIVKMKARLTTIIGKMKDK